MRNFSDLINEKNCWINDNLLIWNQNKPNVMNLNYFFSLESRLICLRFRDGKCTQANHKFRYEILICCIPNDSHVLRLALLLLRKRPSIFGLYSLIFFLQCECTLCVSVLWITFYVHFHLNWYCSFVTQFRKLRFVEEQRSIKKHFVLIIHLFTNS